MFSNKPPVCIGLILDGNRRWARDRGLSTLEGHRKGLETLVETTRLVRDRGIKHMVVYAFSTENWNRSEEEVSYLMSLIQEAAQKRLTELTKEHVRVRFLGQRDRLSPAVQAAIKQVEEASAENDAIVLWICLSYGGRPEIVHAARALQRSGEEVNEASFADHLWSAGMPDPDLVVRTGGEQRLSNFLLWQAAYAELFFIEPYWPDFSEAILDEILEAYGARDRRHGK